MAIPSLAMIPTGFKDGKLYSVLPESGAGDFSVVRGSGATRVNKDGLIESMANDIPRLDYTDGGCPVLLTEPQSTNLVVSSELNNVENIVVSASSYTVSFYGTGSITLSGAHSGTLTGTGVNDRVELTFTPSAGTLICTDSGVVDKKQVEALPYATSYIPTSGVIATRLADSVTGAGDATTFNDSEGVLYFEGSVLANDGNSRFISISDGSSSNRVALLYYNVDDRIRAIVSSGGTKFVDKNVSASVLNNHKVAIKFAVNDFALWVNGVEVATDTTLNAPIGLDTLAFDLGGSSPFYGKAKDVRVYNTALSDAELTELTTI